MKPLQRGFTLIELMIVVAIVAVLASVAYPSYAAYVVRTNRASAMGCLAEMSQFMERVYASNVRYDQNNGAATALPTVQCRTDIASRYTLSFPTGEPTQTTFRIQAAPAGAQAAADAACGTLTLAQTGAKTISGTGTAASCWR